MNPSIFEYERRDFIKKMNRTSELNVLVRIVCAAAFVGLAILFIVHAFPVLSAGPVEGQPVVMVDGKQGDLTTLCAQYRSDHLRTGDKMDVETAGMCGFNN